MKDRDKYLASMKDAGRTSVSEKESGTLGSNAAQVALNVNPFLNGSAFKEPEAPADNGNGNNDATNDALRELKAHYATPVADWTGGTYGAALKETVNKILNRDPFSYDLNGDALYQQYKDQYINAGRLAMQDTIGQASSMTGGYGNSYAATAGNQAYQGQLQNLNNVIPDLYQLAYSVYSGETSDLLNKYNTLQSAYDQEYSQYRDRVSDWNSKLDYLTNMYNSSLGTSTASDTPAVEETPKVEGTVDGGSDDDGSKVKSTYMDELNAYIGGYTVGANGKNDYYTSGINGDVNSYSQATAAVKEDYANGIITREELLKALEMLKAAKKSGDLK